MLLGFSLGCSNSWSSASKATWRRNSAYRCHCRTTHQRFCTCLRHRDASARAHGAIRRYQLLVCYSIVFVLATWSWRCTQLQVLFISRIVWAPSRRTARRRDVHPELLSPQQTAAISVVYGAFSVAWSLSLIGKFVADTLDWHVAMYGTLTLPF
ncbi:MAG: hypothetical protein ACLU0O_04105 [Collinsella sp.]